MFGEIINLRESNRSLSVVARKQYLDNESMYLRTTREAARSHSTKNVSRFRVTHVCNIEGIQKPCIFFLNYTNYIDLFIFRNRNIYIYIAILRIVKFNMFLILQLKSIRSTIFYENLNIYHM